MNVFFGKISTQYDTKQIDGGYYQAPKNSSWYNGIDIGDYAFVIGGNRIQLWKAREWGEMPGGENDKLSFDVILPNIGLETKDLIALKYLRLDMDLIVKTTRSTGAEKKAFFKLQLDDSFDENKLLNPETYRDRSNFRKIRTYLPKQNVEVSYDLQLQFDNGRLKIHPILNCDEDIVKRFKDNTINIGLGQSQKDKTLSILKASSNTNTDLSKKISIKDLFDACMCGYKKVTQETSYWVVNGFDKDKIDYCLEHDSFVMYFQYSVQKKSDVTKQLRLAKKVKPGDKVLLFNKNKFYAHSTFDEVDVIPTIETTLNNQIKNNIKHEPGGVITYTDAKCYYEDLSNDNGFEGEWGQRLNIQEWENINEEGLLIPGISKNLSSSSITLDTIIQLKDKSFYDLVKTFLSEGIKDINQYNAMNETIDLIEQKKQIILQGPPGTGKTYSAKDFAEKIIFNHISTDKKLQKKRLEDSGQFSLVQFHPSYSYEDFVRGITAKNKNGSIVYEAENKILAEFAEKAKANLESSNTDVNELSRKQQISNLIQRFSEEIQEKIDNNGDFKITDAVAILEIEEDAFRYKGNWQSERRMKFNDLIHAQLNGVTTRQGLKNLDGISGLANQHASYFIKVLNKFQKDYASELEKTAEKIDKPELKKFVLIIDEINRANLPSVLGELIYALEYRNETVKSLYAKDGDYGITIPENLFIIGTMNTADRSVGHIDYAIKRRFAFVDVLPNESVIETQFAKNLFQKVSELFIKTENDVIVNSDYLASDFDYKDVQLGHSYFILKEGTEQEQRKEMLLKLKYEILPVLREYVKDGLLLESANEKLNEIATFEL